MSTARSLSLVFAFLAACVVPAAAIGADTPQPKPGETKDAPADTNGKPPLIVHNPDGTFTVQKEPAPGKTVDAEHKGLIIRPQVVVPTLRAPGSGQRN